MLETRISQSGIGDSGFAQQGFGFLCLRPGLVDDFLQAGVDIGVDARNKERGHRRNRAERQAFRCPLFQPFQVCIHHLVVALEGEDQGDVYIDPRCNGIVMAGKPAFVAGILTIRFGRFTRCHNCFGLSQVASVSLAR